MEYFFPTTLNLRCNCLGILKGFPVTIVHEVGGSTAMTPVDGNLDTNPRCCECDWNAYLSIYFTSIICIIINFHQSHLPPFTTTRSIIDLKIGSKITNRFDNRSLQICSRSLAIGNISICRFQVRWQLQMQFHLSLSLQQSCFFDWWKEKRRCYSRSTASGTTVRETGNHSNRAVEAL